MNRLFMRFPEFKGKTLTLSYDDGVRQDKRLIKIMVENGLSGTFNLNSGLFEQVKQESETGRMTKEESLETYNQVGVEVAVHGKIHLSLNAVDKAVATNDVIQDREALENLFGSVIKGMAYAYGTYDDTVINVLKNCGIEYSRTVNSTENFSLPTNWLTLNPTCHHNNSKLFNLLDDFLNSKIHNGLSPKMFYLWGHSYEFDRDNNWGVIETFAKKAGNHEDIWYATNGEIYEYITAYDNLRWSADGNMLHNPSCIDVYINYYGKEIIVKSGKTIKLK